MKKRLVLLTGLLILTAFQGFVVSNSLADTGTFTTMWVIDLPRQTYFIGETVTFTVTAFASTDPTLMLPDQMAKITIRNSSMVEVYATWITTNSNGSAPISWASSLNTTADNYTIILDDLKTTKVTAQFNMLYNEETYWQTRVDLMEQEIQNDRSYLNYLFSYQKYQENRLNELNRQVTIYGVLAFVTVMCAIYVGMHELAGSKRSKGGLMAYPSKAVELVFRSKPVVELDSEILEDVHTPQEKRVPVYGHDFFCPICDANKLHPITETQLRDHLWAKHDRLHLKKDSIRAKWRARRAEKEAEVKKKAKEAPALTLTTVEVAKKEWTEKQVTEQFKARLNEIKQHKKDKDISKEELKAQTDKLREDLDIANGKAPVAPKTTKAPSANTLKVRKLQGETPLFSGPSGIPPKPAIAPPISTPPIKVTKSETIIDLLEEQMKEQQKVN